MAPAISLSLASLPTIAVMVGKIHPLTPAQLRIWGLLSRGLTNKEIAIATDIVEGTVKVHIRSLFHKLKVNNRVKAAVLFHTGRSAQPSNIPPDGDILDEDQGKRL